jgi:hypothetical protein
MDRFEPALLPLEHLSEQCLPGRSRWDVLVRPHQVRTPPWEETGTWSRLVLGTNDRFKI